MKKFENLGKVLNKGEQRKISGGYYEQCGTISYTGCNDCGGSNMTCDYHIVYPSGYQEDWCDQGCLSGCQSSGCSQTYCG